MDFEDPLSEADEIRRAKDALVTVAQQGPDV
jgi:hypothetical protein